MMPGEFLRGELGRSLPGFVCGVWSGGKPLDRDFDGMAALEPESHPVQAKTLFDLASLTKPLCTALLALKAHAEGRMDLEAPIATAGVPPITALNLLRHEAGFPAWAPLYGVTRERVEARKWLLEECPREPAGQRAVYSCLGYILLGFLLEEVWEMDLRRAFLSVIAEPLGLKAWEVGFLPARPLGEIAATELNGAHERAMAEAVGAEPCPVPSRGLWGVVHDGNARFLGGVAGNAGLFGTAAAVQRVAQGYFSSTGFLPAEVAALAWHPGRCSAEQIRTAGFRHASDPQWAAGPALSPCAVGHEGFTGTGLWLEPEAEKVFVLLTNRIHPRHPGTDFGPVRAQFLRCAQTVGVAA